jgi:predicted TIM-barrel fold metal-dependent hydrolase
MRLYEQCARLQLPILFEQHQRNPHAKMEYARPALLDEIAREFPDLRIVISRLGEPWVDETIVLLAKHPCIYSDVAGLLPQPWRSYTALLTAYEYGVLDKVLFGSDFPFRAPAACIEALYTINQFSHGSSLPAIPREHLRGIVERNALDLLRIGNQAVPDPQRNMIFAEDE